MAWYYIILTVLLSWAGCSLLVAFICGVNERFTGDVLKEDDLNMAMILGPICIIVFAVIALKDGAYKLGRGWK